MQDENTLIKLGFEHYPEWDYKEIGVKCYVKRVGGVYWRAHVCDTLHPTSVSLGRVVKPNGIVDRWRDCLSEGSVLRKITAYEENK